MDKERYYWMDLTRIVACFAVFVIHVAAGGIEITNQIIGVICHVAVPLFVMISGANFLDNRRTVTVSKMFKKYILPIFVSFITWSFLYAIYTSWIAYEKVSVPFVKTVIINTVNGHYHMWYIWMTIGMYMIVPFLKKIVEKSNRKELLYFIVIAFMYLTLRYMVQFDAFDYFESMATDLRISFVSGFVIYFVAGKYLLDTKRTYKNHFCFMVMGIIGVVGNLCLTLFQVTCNPGGDVFGYFSPFTILVSISSYWFLMVCTGKFSERNKGWIVRVSGLTFPIFMLHDFGIIFSLNIFGIKEIDAVYTLPISVFVFVICAAASKVLLCNTVTRRVLCNQKS